MRNLTTDEQKKVIQIAEATAKQRHRLMAIEPKGNQSRFFQAQAEFHSMEVLLHHGTGRLSSSCKRTAMTVRAITRPRSTTSYGLSKALPGAQSICNRLPVP